MNQANQHTEPSLPDDDVRERHEDLEGALMERVEDDARLGSGVSEDFRGSSLDFIQMSGLTMPAPVDEAEPSAPPPSDMDPNVPVSFYEKGVNDVDSTLDPLAMEISPGADDVVVTPNVSEPAAQSSAITSLKEIIADLSDESSDDESSIAETEGDTAEIVEELNIDAVIAEAAEEVSEEVVEEAEPELDEIDAEAQTPEPHDDAEVAAPEEMIDVEASVSEHVEPDAELMPDPVVDTSEETELVQEAADVAPEIEESQSPEIEVEEEIAVAEPDPDPEPDTEAVTEVSPEPDTTELEAEPVPVEEVPDVVPVQAESEPIPTVDLSEAENLLQRLEAQLDAPPAEKAKDIALDDLFEMPELPEAVGQYSDADETDMSVYNQPQSPGGRRSGSRRRRSIQRRVIRLALYVALLTGLAIGGRQAYLFYQVETATEQDIYNAAVLDGKNGRFLEASLGFENFSKRCPASPLRAEADFMAAHILDSVPPTDPDAVDIYTNAIMLYEHYGAQHPDHAKYHRAKTLMGMVYFRAGQYRESIKILENPERRKLDPDAYLPSMRTLARAYSALGEIENARSAYLRATSLEGNFSPDVDYLELAALYQSLSNTAESDADRRIYLQLSIEQWDRVLRLPGVLQSKKRTIKAMRDLALEELGGTGDFTEFSGLIELDEELTPEEKHRLQEIQLRTID